MTLLLMSYQGLSQDTLNKSIQVIEYNGKVGLFIDSTEAQNIAHKLEEGALAVNVLITCDSLLTNSKQKAKGLVNVVGNLENALTLAEQKNALEKEITDAWIEKCITIEEDNRRLRQQRWINAGVGVLAGAVIVLIIK